MPDVPDYSLLVYFYEILMEILEVVGAGNQFLKRHKGEVKKFFVAGVKIEKA